MTPAEEGGFLQMYDWTAVVKMAGMEMEMVRNSIFDCQVLYLSEEVMAVLVVMKLERCGHPLPHFPLHSAISGFFLFFLFDLVDMSSLRGKRSLLES